MGERNPCGLGGLDFVEFAAAAGADLAGIFGDFGFAVTARHRELRSDLWTQQQIRFVLTDASGTFAAKFAAAHGPSVCALGFRVGDAAAAHAEAVRRGARPFLAGESTGRPTLAAPAIWGIGDSLLYFVDHRSGDPLLRDFAPTPVAGGTTGKGFLAIDHLTHNVPKGGLREWADFYKQIFGFTEVRYFDIRGSKTGLTSYALRSPDGSFCIPINEGTEKKSQIEEYLREYRGAGVQHIAFLTGDLLGSLDAMRDSSVRFLDIDDDYYESVFQRVPNVREDHGRIREHQVLVDGDEEGYLLQIFTKNLCGPIFIELIQRRNHLSFGEGNFGALFRSIERDQERRGVI